MGKQLESENMKQNRLSTRLRNARRQQGLTLRDVARCSNGAISNPYVCQLESGRPVEVYPHKLRVLAKVLKLDFLELMILAGHLTVQDLKGKV